MANYYLLLSLLLTSCVAAAGQIDLTIPLLHSCGNIEFDIKFMKPTITLYDAKDLVNFAVTDTMDLENPMKVTLTTHLVDTLVIDTFTKPICTKRLLLDVCVGEESSLDSVRARVDIVEDVCYVDMDKYNANTKIQKEAVECAQTDFLSCK